MREPKLERPAPAGSGTQRLYRFTNGYGASVVRHTFSYGGPEGLWELAVIRFRSDDEPITDGALDYGTPVTDDVLGWLDDDAVDAALAQIEALTKVEA